ncbi:MAG: DUF2235 domain-containing protein [Parvularculaceae bacterium]
MAKNIIICLDGTGNQIEANLSSVLKLYRTLDMQEDQIVYYHQGVGTLGQQYTWGAATQNLKKAWGLITGMGLDRNVLDAYRFIVEHYSNGDKLFLFGFSRGAHTARALAAFIYVIGLLRPEQLNLAGAALTIYKQAKSQKGINVADHFRRIAKLDFTDSVAIDFVGVWDTVSSMIVPRPDRFYLPSLEKLPFTFTNPGVKTFRQANAIDEKRRMFRLDGWDDHQEFKPNKYSQGERVAQDVEQVWFAGCHSDVGGGFKREDSAMSQFPLIWMIEEAAAAGLKVNERMVDHVARGKPYSSTTKHNYPKPDHTKAIHKSMTLPWAWMEVLPRSSNAKEWPKRKSFLGFYLPLSEPRLIPEGASIHRSVVDRMSDVPSYHPVNLPAQYNVVD